MMILLQILIFPELLKMYRCSKWAGRSGDGIPFGTRSSTPIQTGPGDHPISYTIGTETFVGEGGGKAAGMWR